MTGAQTGVAIGLVCAAGLALLMAALLRGGREPEATWGDPQDCTCVGLHVCAAAADGRLPDRHEGHRSTPVPHVTDDEALETFVQDLLAGHVRDREVRELEDLFAAPSAEVDR